MPHADLTSPLPLTPAQIAHYREEGFLLLPQAVAPEAILPFQPLVAAQWLAHKLDSRPLQQRDTYGQAFTQALNLGRFDQQILQLSHAKRFAHLAAQLLGVDRVRMFLEEAFFKEPGSQVTPWHQDQSAVPFGSAQIVTLWIPLVPVQEPLGMLRFAARSHLDGAFGPPDISAETDRTLGQRIAEKNYPIVATGPMQLGDISAHAGWTMHSAGPNQTRTRRDVYSLHYFADGARIAQPDNPSKQRILAFLAPELHDGDLAQSPSWPLVFP